MILSKHDIDDTIVAVYKLNIRYNYCNALSVKRESVKIDKKLGVYFLDPFEQYLIICRYSRYRVENNKITCLYNSIYKYNTK